MVGWCFRNPVLLRSHGNHKVLLRGRSHLPRPNKCTEPVENATEEPKHSIILQKQEAMIDRNRCRAMSLILEPALVLATDNLIN